MKVFSSLPDWFQYRASLGGPVGFVPTMGALHAGHLALVKESKKRNTATVVSIFVNPTQFDESNDLTNYPRPIEKDLALLKKLGVDAVLLPSYREIYSDDFRFSVSEKEQSRILCGAHRPGHFDGVLTVVLKLFNITKCHNAYFGEKDFQQLSLVKDMAKSFFLDLEVHGVPTVREADGVAMSSRNLNLSPEQRKLAPQFFKNLSTAKTTAEAKSRLKDLGFEVDYIEDHDSRRYGAVRLGEVRLIDNVSL